jgi:hypothetical protein
MRGHGHAAPLAGRCRGEPLDAVVPCCSRMCHGRVGFVGAGRADAFVLVVDLDGAAEGLLEIEGAPQRRRPPEKILVQDLLGDRDPALGAHLLLDEVHGEDDLHVLGPYRLARTGVKRGIHRSGHVRQDVVPLFGNLRVSEHDLSLFHLRCLLQSRFFSVRSYSFLLFQFFYEFSCPVNHSRMQCPSEEMELTEAMKFSGRTRRAWRRIFLFRTSSLLLFRASRT